MDKRNWPAFGTKKKAMILEVKKGPVRGVPSTIPVIQFLNEPRGAAITMPDAEAAKIQPPLAEGQVRMLEFRRGGVFGAHWFFLDGEVQP